MDHLTIVAENLRAVSPLQGLLYSIHSVFEWITSDYLRTIINRIVADPLLLFPIGVFALATTVSILGRILSRD